MPPLDRVRRLEAALLRRVRLVRPVNEAVREAVRLICASRGQIAVSRVEPLIGISARSLERRFREMIGVHPKTLCRIARFQYTLSLLNRQTDIAAADLVYAGGFFDQPHLLREFRQLAGLLPSAWVAERARVGFIQYIEPLLDYSGD